MIGIILLLRGVVNAHGEIVDSAERFDAARLLLDYAFANWVLADALTSGPLPPVSVALGQAKYLQPELGSGGKVLLKKSEAAGLRRELSLPERVEAPVEAGQVLGRLRLLDARGNELSSMPIVAGEGVKRLDWPGALKLCFRLLLTGWDARS